MGKTKVKISFNKQWLFVLLIVVVIILSISGCNVKTGADDDIFDGYRLIEVYGGDLSGDREPNVVVDIGYGSREYYAFTNEYGQLIKVIAKKIILQNESTEPVLSSGRYYPDEAKVPGVESPTLDEGHVIADALGGVANAYNITPQDSTLNNFGNQAYMEKSIIDAKGCTDFVAIITYPNTTTQIPNHYNYTYNLMGNVVVDSFDNVNPNEANIKIESEVIPQIDTELDPNSKQMIIDTLDKKAEFIILKNWGPDTVKLTGWKILSVRGYQSFIFPEYVLEANSKVIVGDSTRNYVDFHWLEGDGTWNNSESDEAELYNDKGELVYRYGD